MNSWGEPIKLVHHYGARLMEWSSIKARMRGGTSGTSAKPLYHPNVECENIFGNLTEHVREAEEREAEPLRIPSLLTGAIESMESAN